MRPIFWRRLVPRLAVTCAEVDEMPSTELTIAIGSPPTKALGTAGSVGSHWESHWPGAAAAAAGAAALVPCSQRSPLGAGGAPLGRPLAEADQLRASSSLACA